MHDDLVPRAAEPLVSVADRPLAEDAGGQAARRKYSAFGPLPGPRHCRAARARFGASITEPSFAGLWAACPSRVRTRPLAARPARRLHNGSVAMAEALPSPELSPARPHAAAAAANPRTFIRSEAVRREAAVPAGADGDDGRRAGDGEPRAVSRPAHRGSLAARLSPRGGHVYPPGVRP